MVTRTLDIERLLESPSFGELADKLPFRLFVVDRDRRLIYRNRPEEDDPELCHKVGVIHDSDCERCSRGGSDCPVDLCLADGRARRLVLPSHRPGSDQLMEVELQPIIQGSVVRQVLVIQREVSRQMTQLRDAQRLLERRMRQLDIMNQVLAALQMSTDLERILYVILTGLTFGKGLEFNRAFFFVREGEEIAGRMAVGPIDGDEAARIWHRADLQTLSLSELLEHYDPRELETPINRLVQGVRFNLAAAPRQLLEALRQPGCVRLAVQANRQPGSVCLLEEVRSGEAWLAPVRPQAVGDPEDWRGFLLVDNTITGRDPTGEHLDALVSCARHLSFALDRANLNRQLHLKIDELQQVNEALAESRASLVQAEKLATVGRITGNLAHELKTPIVAIGGFSRRLRKDLAEQPKLRSRAEIVLDESRRVEKILDALLDYADPQILRKIEADVQGLLKRLLEKLKTEFEERGIRTTLESKAEELLLWGDPLRLSQLFRCLLQNVLDLNPPDREERACSRLNVRLVVGGEHLSILFEDDGPGIPAAAADQVFEPFYSSKPSAVGLGLSQARDIVQQHGGSLHLLNPLPERPENRVAEPVAAAGNTGTAEASIPDAVTEEHSGRANEVEAPRGCTMEVILPWRYNGKDPVRR